MKVFNFFSFYNQFLKNNQYNNLKKIVVNNSFKHIFANSLIK